MLDERDLITWLDDAAHSFSYTIITAPLPFRRYVATVKLTGRGNQTDIEWQGNFDVEGISVEETWDGTGLRASATDDVFYRSVRVPLDRCVAWWGVNRAVELRTAPVIRTAAMLRVAASRTAAPPTCTTRRPPSRRTTTSGSAVIMRRSSTCRSASAVLTITAITVSTSAE